MSFARKFMIRLWFSVLLINPVFAAGLTRITVGTAAFQVEIAQTPEQRERGLMFRRALPPDQGMLFVQPVGMAAFWMKNTFIALDLLYFDAAGTLLQIEANALPCSTPDCPIYASRAATVRYILEINAGEAARRGIRPDDRLQIE